MTKEEYKLLRSKIRNRIWKWLPFIPDIEDFISHCVIKYLTMPEEKFFWTHLNNGNIVITYLRHIWNSHPTKGFIHKNRFLTPDIFPLDHLEEKHKAKNRLIDLALHRLTEEERFLIIDYYFMGYNYKEIIKRRKYNVSTSRLSQVKAKILKKLRKIMEDLKNEEKEIEKAKKSV